MAPRIVSWNDVKISPVASSSSTPSVVPIESLLSTPYAKSIVPEALRAQPASFLGVGAGEVETLDGSRQQSDDSFIQHGTYFFKDGNVTFLVDGFLYCVHRYFFSRDSVYFSTRFAQLGVHDHEPSSTIVSLGDVGCKDFEAFLAVLYPEDFEERNLSYEQWTSVLHLSTRWGFDSLRKLVLRSIEPPTAYDRLLLARKYAVDHWIIPALTAMCERTAPVSLDEARGMSVEDVVLVATVREHIRSKAIQSGVSPAEISRRVEAMQAGTLAPAADDEVLKGSPTGETGEESDGFEAQPEPVKGKTSMSSRNLVVKDKAVIEQTAEEQRTSKYRSSDPRS